MPANLVRFRVLDVMDAHKLSLRTASGLVVATQLKNGVLSADTELAPGDFVLRYPLRWRNGDVTLQKYPFKVIAAAPLE